MDAIQLLTSQHRSLEGAFDDVLADGIDDDARTTRLARAGDELMIHITAEEQLFYPAVNARRTEDVLLESLEEHLSLKRLLADLLELEPGDVTFTAKVKVLAEQAAHHHKEEEQHLFPKVLGLLDVGHRSQLGSEMLALEQRLMAAGNPRDAVRRQTDSAEPLR